MSTVQSIVTLMNLSYTSLFPPLFYVGVEGGFDLDKNKVSL